MCNQPTEISKLIFSVACIQPLIVSDSSQKRCNYRTVLIVQHLSKDFLSKDVEKSYKIYQQ